MHSFFRDKAATWLLLLVAFYLIPYSQLDHLRMMPGDIGDARLVNYFLEHNHQYFNGNIESLWHPRFFSPFPFVLGFSDNILGSFPIYELIRIWIKETDTAFQIWFLAAYPINYLAANFALRRLGCTPVSSSIGALIFAFSLPVTTHIGHPQLLYRFGVPLAMVMYISFLQEKNWSHFLFASFWLVWQYYCTIYIGFFVSLFFAIISIAFLVTHFKKAEGPQVAKKDSFLDQFIALPPVAKLTLGLGLLFLILAMIWLFYPYLKVSELYGAKRSTNEIASMLPRLQSYFTAHTSLIWKPLAQLFPEIPMPGEHQMFAGAVPLVLASLTLFSKKAPPGHSSYRLMFWAFIGSITLTFSIFGYSLWTPLTTLPLVSAIRAVTRLDLVLLFPIAYFSALAIDKLNSPKKSIFLPALLALTMVLIGEMSATRPATSAKAEWRERLSLKQSELPENIAVDAVLFFNQSKGPWYADEIDSMWVALHRNAPTLNGYSGFNPPGYSAQFSNNCGELARRLTSYMKFSQTEDNAEAYKHMANRIIPIGFDHCPDDWRIPRTKSKSNYTADQIKNISIRFIERSLAESRWIVTLEVKNSGNTAFAAGSAVDKPFRLMGRFVDDLGQPINRWQTRRSLPHDLAPGSSIILEFSIDKNVARKGSRLQVTMEQSAVKDISPIFVTWDVE